MAKKDFDIGTKKLIKNLLMEQISKAKIVHAPQTDQYKVTRIEVIAENGEKIVISYGYTGTDALLVEVQTKQTGELKNVYSAIGEKQEWEQAVQDRRKAINAEKSNSLEEENLKMLQEMFGMTK